MTPKREREVALIADLRADVAALLSSVKHSSICSDCDAAADTIQSLHESEDQWRDRFNEICAENAALHEQLAAIKSPEVCYAAHENVETCGYCQRDALALRLSSCQAMLDHVGYGPWENAGTGSHDGMLTERASEEAATSAGARAVEGREPKILMESNTDPRGNPVYEAFVNPKEPAVQEQEPCDHDCPWTLTTGETMLRCSRCLSVMPKVHSDTVVEIPLPPCPKCGEEVPCVPCDRVYEVQFPDKENLT